MITHYITQHPSTAKHLVIEDPTTDMRGFLTYFAFAKKFWEATRWQGCRWLIHLKVAWGESWCQSQFTTKVNQRTEERLFPPSPTPPGNSNHNGVDERTVFECQSQEQDNCRPQLTIYKLLYLRKTVYSQFEINAKAIKPLHAWIAKIISGSLQKTKSLRDSTSVEISTWKCWVELCKSRLIIAKTPSGQFL